MQDKTVTQIECPKCHRPVLFPAVSVKAKCPNCGEIVRKQVIEKVSHKNV